jgi:hypothetical protein
MAEVWGPNERKTKVFFFFVSIVFWMRFWGSIIGGVFLFEYLTGYFSSLERLTTDFPTALRVTIYFTQLLDTAGLTMFL